MPIKVKNKRSAVRGKQPLPTDLEYGEIAINYEASDPAIYIKDSADAVRRITGSASVTTSDTAPASPKDGDLWYDSVSGRTFVFYDDGTSSQWVDAAPQGGGGGSSTPTKVEVGNTKAEVTDTGSNGAFAVTTEGTGRLTVDSSGRTLLGGVTANANGGVLQLSSGITFPATQVAASDANTLDDYEEGTWTPSVGGNATYNSRSGTYTKIGRFVHVTAIISINTLGTGSSTTITGLPFISAGGLGASNHVGYWSSTSRSVTSLTACTNSNEIVFTDTTTATTGINLNAGIMGNGTDLRFTVTYIV
jgi:hypothetical protein